MKYKVICTRRAPWWKKKKSARIVGLGTRDDPGAYVTWSIDEVIDAIKRGHKFYTQSPSTGKKARVGVWKCKSCKHKHLQTKGDKTKDNDLNSLPRC